MSTNIDNIKVSMLKRWIYGILRIKKRQKNKTVEFLTTIVQQILLFVNIKFVNKFSLTRKHTNLQ